MKVIYNFAKDDPNDPIRDPESFKFKVGIAAKTPDDANAKNVEIVVPFKYLGNYWRTLEMQLKNREINLILTWAANYVLANSIGVATFAITYTKLYV